jgi:hypothetical protein
VASTTGEKARYAGRELGHRLHVAGLDRILTPLARRAHADYDPTRTVSVLGSRRGGTTWLHELMTGAPGVCPIFEPLYDSRWRRHVGLEPVPVLDRDDPDPALERFLDQVRRGWRVGPRGLRLTTARELLRADQFVVKHVRLNLCAGWLARRLVGPPLVLLVRHPCAVVESMRRVRWGPDSVRAALAELPPLERDRVTAAMDGRTSVVAALAGIWAVEVGTLLRQTDPQTALLLSYEALVADPAGALGPVLETVRVPRPPQLLERSTQPSRSTHDGSVVHAHGNPTRAWTDRLSATDRDEVLGVVRDAGITAYGPDPEPDDDALRQLHADPVG